MNPIEPNTHSAGTPWTISVLLLCLPSLIFVALHALYKPGRLPGLLDLVLVWTTTVTGMLGALLTLAACVISLIATFQKQVPRTAKIAMWAFVSASFLACVYASRIAA